MTNRTLLNPQAADHLVKLLGYLGSDHQGERAAAALKTYEFIRRLGLTWSDVVYCPSSPASWWDMAIACRKQRRILSERDFLNNIAKLRRLPSDKQLAWLESIYARLHDQGAAA